MSSFESDNLRAYSLLLKIEIVLREILARSFEGEFGPAWQKRLPGDLLVKIKKSQVEENRPQFGFIRLGPLYYLTFGELLTILQQGCGKTAAKQFGGDVFVRQLENLFSPRNAVCHSRPVSVAGLKAIECLYAQIEAALTPDKLAALVADPSIGLSVTDAVVLIHEDLSMALSQLSSLPTEFNLSDTYQQATLQYWWANDSLAGFCCGDVELAHLLLQEYNGLSGGVGAIAERLRLVEERQMTKKLISAIQGLKGAML